MSALRTLLVVLFLAPYSVLASMLGYPLARLQGSPALLYFLGRFGARAACRLAGVRIELEGLDHVRDHGNLVLMPTDVSNLDAAILFGHILLPFKAVVKRELFAFPFVHYCLRYAGFIEVDRRDPGRARSAMTRAAASLKAGSCFIIFPEGTRSPNGELGEFKKGAFAVAIEAGGRVAPGAGAGGGKLMPGGRVRTQAGAG